MEKELYREIVLDHYRNPQHRGRIELADFVAAESNPLCGDSLEFCLTLEGQKIRAAAWWGDGCALSLAAADLLAENIEGESLDEVVRMTKEDVLAMVGVDPGPARLKCVLLALSCVHKGLRERGLLPEIAER